MSAEGHYLDAIEAEEEGDFDAALEHAQLAVKSDPEHSNAWWMVTCLLAPDKNHRDHQRRSDAMTESLQKTHSAHSDP